MDPESTEKFQSVLMDGLSWSILIKASLNHMHGLIGESSIFDVLEYNGTRAIIRTHEQDSSKFMTSLSAHHFNLENLIGSTDRLADKLNCCICVREHSKFLGLVLLNEIMWICHRSSGKITSEAQMAAPLKLSRNNAIDYSKSNTVVDK